MKYLIIKNLYTKKLFNKIEKKKLISKVIFRNLFSKKKINLDVFINQNFIKKSFLQNKTRIRSVSRCMLTNRSRGVSKKFNLSRFILRDLMQFGLIPGYSKSVW